jgi:hypothetical protein
MVCLSCAEALGLIEKPKPRPAPEVRPLIEVTPESAPAAKPVEPQPEPKPEPAKPVIEAAAISSLAADKPFEPMAETAQPASAEQVTIVTPQPAPPPPKEAIVIDNAPSDGNVPPGGNFPPGEPQNSVHLSDTGPAPKSAASETVVSQRGNTLQVPKVSPTLGKPPQPIASKPRKALRSTANGGGPDWTMIGMVAGTVVLGIVGFVLILAALAG